MHLALTIYYTIISKMLKYNNNPIVKRSKTKADDIILDACMAFESYRIKTVGEDAVYTYYISNNYFKISKIVQSSKQPQARLFISCLMPACNLKTIR